MSIYLFYRIYKEGWIKMAKKRVSIQIEGRNYVLITTDDEKYVSTVADEVIKRIRKAAQTSKNLDTRDCAVLAALDLCDDKNKAVKKNKDIVGKADQIIQNTNDLNKSCKEYKERLAEAINENTRLVKRIKALENQLRTLSNESIDLKESLKSSKKTEVDKPVEKTAEEKKNEKMMGYVPMRQYSLFEDKNEKN